MTGMDRSKGWRPIGQLCWNTRIGLNFTKATWTWVLAHLPLFHVVYLQEVKDVAKIRHIMGPEWIVHPFNGGGAHTTTCVVALRDRRFTVIDRVRDEIASAKHEREIIALLAIDKKTKRTVVFGSMHVDPLGKGFVRANPRARARHILQVKAWAHRVELWFQNIPGAAVFIGGDVNERMNEEHQVALHKPKLAERTTLAQFRAVGLKAAAYVRHQSGSVTMLDIFGGGQGVKCVQRLQVTVPKHIEGGEFFDHPLVYARYGVKGQSDV